jgi:FixJ family two-component response regulator
MNTAEKQTVYVIDDDESIRRSIARLLKAGGFHFETHASANEFLASCHPDMAGCLILDLNMPEMDGLAVQQALAKAGCALPVIFLTGHGDIRSSVTAMKAGAEDFLTKPVLGAVLVEAIQRAFARDSQARERSAEVASLMKNLERLTPREHEVLRLIVRGFLNKQIAAELGTVEKTIKVHRARVMAKLEAGSLAELVTLVERAGVFRDSAA